MDKLNLDQFLPYQLSFASNLTSEVIASSYERLFGLKIPEWRLLAVIAEADGITQLDIGLRTRMDKVTVSRAALAMQARGLIERRPNPNDGRSHVLRLSAAGDVLYQQVVPQALKLEKALFDGLDAKDLKQFSRLLEKISNAALQHLEAPRGRARPDP
jgi:DNA-binding MarR family transcriptional regulator